MPQTLYEQTRDAQGLDYVKARDALFATGSAAADLLKDRAKSATDPNERWEAEALLARSQNSDEFTKLGKTFAELVGRLKAGFPQAKASGEPILRLDVHSGLLLPDEPSPLAQMKDRLRLGSPETQVKFIDTLRITDSPLWPAVLAEIVLKGYAAADPTIPPPPSQVKMKRLPHDFLNGFSGPPAGEDYVIQAMLLLAKMGENRIVPKATAILKDPSFTPQDRSTAAKALSLVKEPTALDPLLELAADENTPAFLHQNIFFAIGRKKDPKAIPVLEKVISDAPKVRSANEAGWGPWFRGAAAKQARDAILAPAPAPGRAAPALH